MNCYIKSFLVLLLSANVTIQDVRINILHQQRFHSKFPAVPFKNGSRYGIARIIHYVKQEKASDIPTLFFDTMDWFGGGIWFSIHRWRICADFLEILPVDALSLGCYDLLDGPKDVRELNFRDFILQSKKNVNLVNGDVTNQPLFEGLFVKSKTFEQAGITIGVIGFMSSYANTYLNTKMRFKNEVIEVQKEVNDLKTQGVDFIVLLSHSGEFMFDQQLIQMLYGVNLVIGGHSLEFFYNGIPPSSMEVDGEYPTIVKSSQGEDVMVVYSGGYGMYVGKLELTFYENKTLKNYTGNPVHMDETIGEDQIALDTLKKYSRTVHQAETNVVGETRVVLNGSCLGIECNLGNLVVDSFVEYRASIYRGKYWSDVAIGVMNSNEISGDIIPNPTKNNTLTLADIYNVLPFVQQLVTVKMKGKSLRKALEVGASDLDVAAGRFLQVSGIQVEYNTARPPFQRVIRVEVRCQDCGIPEYFPLEDDGVYNVITNRFIGEEGGLGFYMFLNESLGIKHEDATEVHTVRRYLNYYGSVAIGTEERIIIDGTGLGRLRSAAFTQRKKLIVCGVSAFISSIYNVLFLNT